MSRLRPWANQGHRWSTVPPDGWSGVSVLSGYGGLPAGEGVVSGNYYASADRADGNHNIIPLIVREEGGAFAIWDIGPTQTPDAPGDHAFDWSSQVVPADGAAYHPAIWQWNEGVDNEAGGLVPFSGSGGSGMFQMDQDGTSYVPTIGDPVTDGHSSGADGRAYQFNLITAVPEPGSVLLLISGLLGLFFIGRQLR